MIASRADSARCHRRRCVVAVLAGLSFAVALPGAARAQTPLTPATPAQTQAAPQSAPAALAPPQALRPAQAAKPAAGQAPAAPPPGPGRSEPGVEVNPLETVDLETVGTLGSGDGGLGMNLWQGADRAFVETMLDSLPARAPSPTMRGLMRRLLLTAAQPPKPKADAIPPSPDGEKTKVESLIARRVRLLAAMGDAAGVGDLLTAIPGNVTDSALLQVEANARFLANDNARACAIAAQQVATRDAAYWQRAMIFCQILAGEPGKAELGIAMLNELGQQSPAFNVLVDRLLGGTAGTVKSIADADGLLLAMARAAKAPLPEDAVKSDRPGVLRAISVNPNVAASIRLEAAERAEAAGALDTEALRQLYSSITFEPGDLNRPLSRADEIGGPVARALLYHSALSQSVPTAQAEIIARALNLAVTEGRYGAAARVFQPLVAKIPPSASLLWFAPDAVRLMLSNNDPEGAKNWFRLLQASALFDDQSKALLVRLTPLVRLVGTMGLEQEPRDLSVWWRAVAAEPGAAARAALLYGLLDGMGEDIPFEAWREPAAKVALAPPPASTEVPPLLLFRLRAVTEKVEDWIARGEAREGGGRVTEAPLGAAVASTGAVLPRTQEGVAFEMPPHRGEMILMSMVALGDGGVAKASAPVMRQIVAGLSAVGLDAEARSLALEAALAAGL